MHRILILLWTCFLLIRFENEKVHASELCPYRLSKPQVSSLGEGCYELKWKAIQDSEVVYHVVGCCTDKEVPPLVLARTVATTTEASCVVDRQYPYYRIFVEKNGEFSLPSEIIPLSNSTDNDSEKDYLVSTQFQLSNGLPEDSIWQITCSSKKKPSSPAKNYQIPSAIWDKVSAYILPDDHPVRKSLDKIFKRHRAVLNEQVLLKAGFENAKKGRFSQTIVTRHKKIRGYYFKLFLENQPVEDWILLAHRIVGANSVRKAIEEHGWTHLFKVPKKWLYPIPVTKQAPGKYRKYFILVATDADIFPSSTNRKRWKTAMTRKKLHAFYTLLKEVGANDSVWPFNSPFAKDGKIAFIDTEHHHHWPLPYNRLTTYLSPRLQIYWEKLTQH